MEDQERPSIELFMHSLNQEFPAEKGHEFFLRRRGSTVEALGRKELERVEQVETEVFRKRAGDWSVQWISNEWIENHTKAAGMGIREVINPMDRVIVREEDFGGIVFEPTSDQVFRVNQPGLKLFNALREQHQEGRTDFADVEIEGFDPGDVRDFVGYLEGAGLWTGR